MPVRLYVLSISNPSLAAAGMLRHKRIPHRLVTLPPGTHPLLLRAAGFAGATVPALELDGRAIQGSLAISRALEEFQPEPPLFPAERREAVEQAERWGEAELQPVPRRIFRWALLERPELQRWLAQEVLRSPAPRLAALAGRPMLSWLAKSAGADAGAARRDAQRLPALLDHADALIAEGTIGGERLNAADFQIASTVLVLLHVADFAPLAEGRPCAQLARRLFSRYPVEVPPLLPAQWLPTSAQLSEGSLGMVASRE
jgi:glutathione S-transferase